MLGIDSLTPKLASPRMCQFISLLSHLALMLPTEEWSSTEWDVQKSILSINVEPRDVGEEGFITAMYEISRKAFPVRHGSVKPMPKYSAPGLFLLHPPGSDTDNERCHRVWIYPEEREFQCAQRMVSKAMY